MKQIICKRLFNICYGSTTSRGFILGGYGDCTKATTFGADYAKGIIPIAGTLRNLRIICDTPHPNFTATLYVNGVASLLTVSLTSVQTAGTDYTNDIAISANDDVFLNITGALQPAPGFTIGISIEFEGAQSIYGLTAYAGSLGLTNGLMGGGLGNGFFQIVNLASLAAQLSTSYSICAANGNLTRLTLKSYAGAPGAGTWTAYVRKNGITQDGTGGTVDTACVMTGVDTLVTRTFTLPVTIQDHVDILVIRSGIAAPFALAQFAASVAFTPTISGQFMFCGGNNNARSELVDTFDWPGGPQNSNTDEDYMIAPVGETGLSCLGLYLERRNAPAPGKSEVFSVRKNGVDTDIAVTISDTETSGLDTGLVAFVDTDTVVISCHPVNTPTNSAIYWGLAALVVGNTTQIVIPTPGSTVDNVFINDTDEIELAIPNPFIETALLGS